ncbi:hypothetical protein RRG08_054888 [Elysia crispata]|uniref:Uncharacterized protein n=1 Tax=Elysia crispata TaxID=231223 RepID=A0AAE1A5C4_9GAST|nr:hypothetical protein RRG08_054888 [Elysia crispata]
MSFNRTTRHAERNRLARTSSGPLGSHLPQEGRTWSRTLPVEPPARLAKQGKLRLDDIKGHHVTVHRRRSQKPRSVGRIRSKYANARLG